jgi:membrane protease YdiL (CAAX protease family)
MKISRNNPLHFFRDLFRQQLWVILWVNWLMLIGFCSLFFISRTEAQVTLGTLLASAALLLALYARFGYEKILGLGHILWIPALIYLALQVGEIEAGVFRSYIIIVLLSYGISLLLDVYDVWMYFRTKVKWRK